MGVIVGPSVGKITTPVGQDGSNFRPVLCDTFGRLIMVVGHDGTTYRVLKCNASGQVEVLISGTVPDADKLDGYHAAAFLLKAGGTMTGDIVLAGAPSIDLHPASKKYVDDLIVSPGSLLKHVWSPLAPPSSANTKDDEFSDSSWDTGKWTEWDQPNKLTVSEVAGGAVLTNATNAGHNLAGVFQAQADADFTIWTRVSLGGIAANYFQAGLMLGIDLVNNPATSDILTLHIQGAAASWAVQATRWSDYATHLTNYASYFAAHPVNAMYLRMRQLGNTLYWDYSLDGFTWVRLYTSARPLTPAQVGIFANNEGTGANTIARFDFFRALDSAQALTDLPAGRLIHLWG